LSGEFRKNFITVQSLPAFFHRVKARIARSVVKLYPREGDVWTLYKTWNKKSVSVNAEAKKFEHELVVQSSLSVKLEGLKVVPLLKVFEFQNTV
jgi:hypothetical protein